MNNSDYLIKNRPWLSHYDEHVPSHIEYPDTTLTEKFEQAVDTFFENPFLTYKGSTFPFSIIGKYTNTLAGNLIKLGIKKGDRIALVLPNIPQFVIAYYAILKAGGIVVALNPNYKLSEFQYLLKISKPKFIFCLDSNTQIIYKVAKSLDLRIIVVIAKEFNEYLENKAKIRDEEESSIFLRFSDLIKTKTANREIKFPNIYPDDPAIFQFSGGTTGIPKAAIGLHRNLVANVIQFRSWCKLQPGKERILAVIPLYHVYGMVLALNIGAFIGGEIFLIDDPRDTNMILEEIESHSITFYPGVPSMYYAINQNSKVKQGLFNLSSIKACISGSAPLHPQIKKEFEELTGGKLVEGYGLSEAPTATHCNPLFGKNKIGSIGIPLPDVDCRVVDLSTGKKDVQIGDSGELILKGPQVMAGYSNSKENEKALRNGWLHTGDVVKMDNEGYFFIIDRKKSLIKVGGFQVWPNEIESVLNSHPLIKESAVGGISDIEKGERVIAWIVSNKGCNLKPEEVINWCEMSLVSYKIPSEIIFKNQLPRTNVGKILRRELLSEYKKNNPIQ